jgi:hypothetical protein
LLAYALMGWPGPEGLPGFVFTTNFLHPGNSHQHVAAFLTENSLIQSEASLCQERAFVFVTAKRATLMPQMAFRRTETANINLSLDIDKLENNVTLLLLGMRGMLENR